MEIMKAMKNILQGFFTDFITGFIATMKGIFGDVGVVMILIIAPLIYGIYYPLPYSNERVRNLPIAIVDHSNDSLSRQLIRRVSAAPALITQVVPSEQQAQSLLLDNSIIAFMVIPANIQRSISTGEKVDIDMIGNGTYILPSKNAQQAMATAILSLSKDIEIKRLKKYGLDSQKIATIQNPIPLQIQHLYNQNEGYGSYVVPAVAWLILQQTLIISCAMLVSTLWEKRQAYASPSVWIGRIVAMSTIHYLICLAYTGSLFTFWGYTTGANPWGNILLILIFSPCIASLGCLLGLLIKDRERTMQVLVFAALPMYFVSGVSWPTSALPELLQYIRWILPSTSVIQAGISFNQLGGDIQENIHYLTALLIITRGNM